DLRPQPVVLGVEVGDERREVLRRFRLELRAAGLAEKLDDDEQPEDRGDERDRELAAGSAHRGRHGALPAGPLGDTLGGSTGDGLATARDSTSVTVPANAGTVTASGSAHEI